MILFAMRNLKIFFRDRTAVFFSLLGVIIIIALYVLFLGDTVAQDIGHVENARFLMDSWIMAGLLAITSVTTTLGGASVVIDDRHRGIAKDFHSSPLSRSSIVGGYVVSIVLIGVIMCAATFVLAEIYILANGGTLLPLASVLKAAGLIILSVLASSSLIFFLVSFFTHS